MDFMDDIGEAGGAWKCIALCIAAVIVIGLISSGTQAANDKLYEAGYELAIENGGVVAELKIQDKYTTYSTTRYHSTPHFCFTFDVNGGKEEVEVSLKTYNAYRAGDYIPCVMFGNTIRVEPVLE